MAEIPVVIYDTQGIPVSGSGVGFDDLGISYGDMDSLGVWLAVRKGKDFVVGMRIDHIFENKGLGRDNRYIILIKVPAEKMDAFVEKFPELVQKIISDFEESYNVAYRGKLGEIPFIDPGDAERITRLVKLVPKYDDEILRKHGLSRERLRVRVEGFDYDDPGIGDRAAAIRLMFEVLKRAESSPLTGLMVFSKASSAAYPGIWIEKNAKTPEELIDVLESECGAIKRALEECLEEKERCLRDLERCREEREKYRRESARYKNLYQRERKSKGIAFPIVAGISVVLLLVGLMAGAYLHSSGMLPLFGKPAKIIHPSWANLKNVSYGLSNSSKAVIEGYVGIINRAERENVVDLKRLAQLVVSDSRLHRGYQSNITRLNVQVNELKEEVFNLKEELTTLNSTLVNFEKESKCFSELVGENLTLTKEDLEAIKKDPVSGWEAIMTKYCRLKLNETRKGFLESSLNAQGIVNGSLGTLIKIQNVSNSILKSNVTNGDRDLRAMFENFTKAVAVSLNTTVQINKGIVAYTSELETFNVSSVGSCSEACSVGAKWEDDLVTINSLLSNNLTRLPAVKVMDELRQLYLGNKTVSSLKDVEILNVSSATKGLIGYAVGLPDSIFPVEDFWKEVGKLINDLNGVNNPTDAEKYLEKLLELLKFINRKLEGT